MQTGRCKRCVVVLGVTLSAALAGGLDAAYATPVADLSRSDVAFSETPAIAAHVQPVFVTNTGDAPLHISSIALSGANASDFVLGGSCVPPITLVAGSGRCRIDITSNLGFTGAANRVATVVIASDASPAAAAINISASYTTHISYGIQTSPNWLDFGAQPVGVAAPAQTFTIATSESVGLTFQRVVLVGGASSDFSVTTDCRVGLNFVNGASCTMTVGFLPTVTGPRSTELEVDFQGLSSRYSVTGVGGVTSEPSIAPAIEYYNASQDHYFMTWIPNEIAILDAGVTIRGWTRTGRVFNTYTTAVAGTSPVCRFYIPPNLGDSHFYGRGTSECAATGRNNPSFVLEDPDFMNMFLPTLGVCPAGTTEVYRVFDNRVDANHRYMTDRSVRAQMVAAGWVAEGDGPNLVVMCAP